ncbi:MAG: hypothetical protein MUE73_16520 [Planctomycetes bacterium]|jgi:hypothetical protein|nr:hypothetical protein [Planctomycetota bacterium]
MLRDRIALLALAVLVAATGCSKEETPTTKTGGPAAPAPAFKCENTAENLRALFVEIGSAIRSGDTAKAAALSRILLPDRDRLAKGLRENPGEVLDKAWGAIEKFMPASDADAAKVFATDAARTEVRVHGTTVEDLAKYEEGSVAFAEFPGGTKKLAEQGVLRSGLTFYEVEVLEPGQDSGMKYHLFFFDGDRWTMAGPIWRAF